MSIRYRLLLTMIALSSIAVVCSLLAYRSAKNSLRTAAIRQLSGIRRSRAYAVESYFERVRHDTDSLSDDRMFIEGLGDFNRAYARLKTTADPGRRANVPRFYKDVFLPDVQTYMSLPRREADCFPQTEVAYLLQDRYVVRQPSTDNTQKEM